MIADYATPRRRPVHRFERERRQVVAFGAALLLALGLLVFLASAVYGGTSGGAPDTVTVRPGDSLWSIAQSHTDGDVRAEVDSIVTANHLSGSGLRPGQTLVVPAP